MFFDCFYTEFIAKWTKHYKERKNSQHIFFSFYVICQNLWFNPKELVMPEAKKMFFFAMRVFPLKICTIVLFVFRYFLCCKLPKENFFPISLKIVHFSKVHSKFKRWTLLQFSGESELKSEQFDNNLLIAISSPS